MATTIEGYGAGPSIPPRVPPDPTTVTLPGERAASLAMLIEGEIIPRLVLAHAAPPPRAPNDLVRPGAPPSTPVADARDVVAIAAADVDRLAALALGADAERLFAAVEATLARGCTVETVLVDLIAPAARQLGIAWEDDSADFVEVTMALWRLQEAVHELGSRRPGRAAADRARRVLFATAPGDQHSFGTVVIDELFRRDGWTTERLTDAATTTLVRRAAEACFDLIGLTVTCDASVAGLTSIIMALRSVSRNPHVRIIVGGRVFVADPALATAVGADGTAADARGALDLAAALVAAARGMRVAA